MDERILVEVYVPAVALAFDAGIASTLKVQQVVLLLQELAAMQIGEGVKLYQTKWLYDATRKCLLADQATMQEAGVVSRSQVLLF